LKNIFLLLQKDLTLEWKQKYAFGGILVYLITSIFILYLTLDKVRPYEWNALLWLTILNSTLSYVSKNYLQENNNRMMYFKQIVSPVQYILSKILSSIFVVSILSIVDLFLLMLILDIQPESIGAYSLLLVLGSSCISSVFIMSAALASHTKNGFILMPLISLPIQIPIYLIINKAGRWAMDGIIGVAFYKDIFSLFLLLIGVCVMAAILYPFLHKE